MIDQRQGVARAAPPRTFEEVLRLLRGGASQRSFYLMWDTGLLAQMIPELAAYIDDAGDASEVVWKRLLAADRLARTGRLPNDAILLSALLLSPAEEYMEGEREPLLAFDSFIEDLAQRFTIPRRIRERMRLLVAMQKRFREGKVGNLVKREFFADSAMLYGMDCEARDVAVPNWAYDVSLFPSQEPTKPKKKRGA